jgi:hypothetical protein
VFTHFFLVAGNTMVVGMSCEVFTKKIIHKLNYVVP